MKVKCSAFVCAILGLSVALSESAATTNGRLLKFFPITKQQYQSITALTKRQPIVSEADVFESHRSLAGWSKGLYENWNALLKLNGGKTNDNSYPICVVKAEKYLRSKRSGKEYGDGHEYAGLVPNVIFSSSYYGTPQYPQKRYIGGKGHLVVETDHNNDDDDCEYECDEKWDSHDDEDHEHENRPIIKCIVVVQRKKSRPSSSHSHPHPHPHPQPEEPSFPYPLPIPLPIPLSNYYPLPYPPPPYFPQPHPSGEHASSRKNEFPLIDPTTAAQYQRMIAKYYMHLHSLYTADADSTLSRADSDSKHIDVADTNNEDDIEKGNTDKKKRQEIEES